MGYRSWRSFFVLLWVYFFVIRSASAGTICELQGCNCTVKVALWKTINCTLRDVQELNLELLHIPEEAQEIFITGGNRISLGQSSFHRMLGLTLLRIEGTRTLVMEKQSFRNLTTPSLLIQIQNCDQLSIKTGAFENVQSSIEVEITRCASVNVEKTAFSKLKSALFKEVPKLTLATKTFEFVNQGNIGRHGPVTTIYFDNVTISTIPHQAFFSTLAEVKFQRSSIGDIQNDAFSPTQLSSISIANTNIDCIHTGAFNSRTLILNFKIGKCNIKKIESGAITASMGNLTVEHSSITDIQSGAINSTVARVEIGDNNIENLQSSSLVFHNWNKIAFEQNVIEFLHSNSIVVNSEVAVEFAFNDNDVSRFESGALSFVPELEDRVFTFKNNFFEQTCHCSLDEWIVAVMGANVTSKINKILNTTFCRVNELLSQCFALKVGVINMQNFTELVCNTNNTIVCEPYRGETKIVNTTVKMLNEDESPERTNWLTVIIGTSSILILLVIVTIVIMLIRGSRWLKRKGYFRKMQYIQNEHSNDNDEENTIETVDEGDKLDISEDLTMELLQDLSKKLDDPLTHQEACEMIEQLYQKYIHNTGIENNNQHDDEAHLYEELGNLQSNGVLHDPNKQQQNGPRSILRIMEEKFNTHFEDIDADDDNNRPPLVGEYSEPSDAAVHLYSEVRQNKDCESDNKDSLKSRASSNMAFRPLPDKPGSSKM